nr:hypothetical protein [Mycobacterium lepromatosis]
MSAGLELIQVILEPFPDHGAQHRYVSGIVGHGLDGYWPTKGPEFVGEIELGVPMASG